MTTIFYVFLLACSVFLSGCRRSSQPSKEEAPAKSVEKIPEKKACHMIKIENLTVKEKTLTLDYQVSDPFLHDIWFCEDIDTKGKYDVETRIDAKTLWIKLRLNLESNAFICPPAIGKYRRLLPGESHSGRIVLNLPIRNASPVYVFGENRKEHNQVFLNRVVFEVGYFEGELINMISEAIEKFKRETPNEDLQKLKIEPLIVEEIKDGQLLKFLYVTYTWAGPSMEKSSKVVITDVDIPCSVAVDDKKR